MHIHTCLVLPEQIFMPSSSASLYSSLSLARLSTLSRDIYEYIRSTAMVFRITDPIHRLYSWLFLSLSIRNKRPILFSHLFLMILYSYPVRSLMVLLNILSRREIQNYPRPTMMCILPPVFSCLPVIGQFSYQCSCLTLYGFIRTNHGSQGTYFVLLCRSPNAAFALLIRRIFAFLSQISR